MNILKITVIFACFSYAFCDEWPRWGGPSLNNDRYDPDEILLSPQTVSNLHVKWNFTARGTIQGGVTMKGNLLYFVDYVETSNYGFAYCLNKNNASIVWQKNITDLIGYQNPFGIPTVSRNAPAIYKNAIVMGTLGGAYIFALDRLTGNLLWKTSISSHPFGIISQSATVYKDTVFVGVSSLSESFAEELGLCCDFIGSFNALNVNTGEILWSTNLLPRNYSGAAVWGNSPAIDWKHGRVFIATGNTYTVPDIIDQCERCRLNSTDPANFPTCIIDENHADSAISFDIDTGDIIWATSVSGWDTWNYGCGFAGMPQNSFCPIPGPDFDFGQAPVLVDAVVNGVTKKLAIVGQKSGKVWAFDAESNLQKGQVIWTTQVCPGGASGGIMFGSASDGERFYTACTNGNHINYTTINGESTTGGLWAALNLSNGAIIWQTLDPTGLTPPASPSDPRLGPEAPVMVANGVVYGGTTNFPGYIYAMNAVSGQILWSFQTGGSVAVGGAISDGVIYWPSGYIAGELTNHKLYAFSL